MFHRIVEHVRGVGVNPSKYYRSKGGLLFPEHQLFAPNMNIVAVLCNPDLPRRDRFRVIPGHNIVTNEGDLYYAEMGAAETPTADFDGASGRMQVGTGAGAEAKTQTGLLTGIATSYKAIDGTYPQTNDGDADNTGAGVDIITWLTSYTKADFNDTVIAEVVIGIDGTANSQILDADVTDECLMRGLFAATFDKTANDTLKVFVNHEMLGV